MKFNRRQFLKGASASAAAIAAPAFAASIDALAICLGVIGKFGCLLAVSPDPVTAHDTITLLFISDICSILFF